MPFNILFSDTYNITFLFFVLLWRKAFEHHLCLCFQRWGCVRLTSRNALCFYHNKKKNNVTKFWRMDGCMHRRVQCFDVRDWRGSLNTQHNISQIETNEVSGKPLVPLHTLPAFTFHLFMSITVYQISLDQHNLHNRPRIAHFSKKSMQCKSFLFGLYSTIKDADSICFLKSSRKWIKKLPTDAISILQKTSKHFFFFFFSKNKGVVCLVWQPFCKG